jgi:cupin fold WbuC family metalloprotein
VEKVKLITQDLLHQLGDKAASSTRLRANHNIHPKLDDPVQRFFNAMQPGTYVRPHRHTEPPRWELFFILSGHVSILLLMIRGRFLIALNCRKAVR